jgi:hypothetical protein
MRPAGIIRRAALQTAWDLALARSTSPMPGATSRDIVASLVPLGYGREAVRNTVKNLTRAGTLRPVGSLRVADSNRQLVVLAPAALLPQVCTPGADLARALHGWAA